MEGMGDALEYSRFCFVFQINADHSQYLCILLGEEELAMLLAAVCC